MVAVAAGRFLTPIVVETVRSDAERGADGKVNLRDGANWREFLRERAEVIAVTMRESVYAQQPVAAGTTRITVRRSERTDRITHRMRVRACGRVYNIDGIVPIGNPPRLIEFSCVEVR